MDRGGARGRSLTRGLPVHDGTEGVRVGYGARMASGYHRHGLSLGMGKPTALGLVRRALTDAYVVDVRKGAECGWVVDAVIDSPAPVYAGRYVLIPVRDAELMLKRLVAAEGAMMLAKAMRRRKAARTHTQRSR